MLNVASIDKALKILALNRRYRFNAHQVALLSENTDVNEVYNYLSSREPYVLKKHFEVLCPDRMDSAASYDKYEDIRFDRWLECRICGEEFMPDPDLIHIVFYFTDNYLKQITNEVEVTSPEKKARHLLMTTH